MGAALGALVATFFRSNWMVYGAGIFLFADCSARCCGWAAQIAFAAIRLTIVLLITHSKPPWSVALHRFVEVSLGIAVALVVSIVWRIPGSRVS